MHAGREGLFLLEQFSSPFLSDPCLIVALIGCGACALQQAAELTGVSPWCYCGNCKAVSILEALMYSC